MSRQIIKQPDGQFAIWNDTNHKFDLLNADKTAIKGYYERVFMKRMQKKLQDIKSKIEEVDNGGEPYYQFTKDFDECMEIVEDSHGEDKKEEILNKLDWEMK